MAKTAYMIGGLVLAARLSGAFAISMDEHRAQHELEEGCKSIPHPEPLLHMDQHGDAGAEKSQSVAASALAENVDTETLERAVRAVTSAESADNETSSAMAELRRYALEIGLDIDDPTATLKEMAHNFKLFSKMLAATPDNGKNEKFTELCGKVVGVKMRPFPSCGDTMACFIALFGRKGVGYDLMKTDFFPDSIYTAAHFKDSYGKAKKRFNAFLAAVTAKQSDARIFILNIEWGTTKLVSQQKTHKMVFDRSKGKYALQVLTEDVMSYKMSQNHIWAVLWNGHAWQVYQGYIPGDIKVDRYSGKYIYSMGYDLQGWLQSCSPFATTDGFDATVMDTYLGHLRTFVKNGDPRNPKPFDCDNHAALFLEREDSMQGENYVPQFDFTEFKDHHVNTNDALKGLMSVTCPTDYVNTTQKCSPGGKPKVPTGKPQVLYPQPVTPPTKPTLSTMFGLFGATERYAKIQRQYVQIFGMNWHLKMNDFQMFKCKNATLVGEDGGQQRWQVDANVFWAYGRNLWKI